MVGECRELGEMKLNTNVARHSTYQSSTNNLCNYQRSLDIKAVFNQNNDIIYCQIEPQTAHPFDKPDNSKFNMGSDHVSKHLSLKLLELEPLMLR